MTVEDLKEIVDQMAKDFPTAEVVLFGKELCKGEVSVKDVTMLNPAQLGITG